MRRSLRNFWMRSALSLLVMGGLYTFIILLPRIHARAEQQLPNKAMVQFQAKLDQNYLAYQALTGATSQGKATYYSLGVAVQNLETSRQDLSSALSHPPEQVDTGLVKNLKETMSRETNLITEYKGRLNTLSKPFQYIPEEDLAASSTREAKARAASQALAALADAGTLSVPVNQVSLTPSPTFQLSASAKADLGRSVTCLDTLATQLHEKSLVAEATLHHCVAQYELTRKQLGNTIAQPLNNDTGKAVQAGLVQALQRLAKQINH